MNRNTLLGRKFDSCHQLAVLLTRHMQPAEAVAVCRENGWDGVRRALEEQNHMITRPALASRSLRAH
ncbi:MAG: hypothetical protein WD673_03250 [Alphaproteobacteria bacterium]